MASSLISPLESANSNSSFPATTSYACEWTGCSKICCDSTELLTHVMEHVRTGKHIYVTPSPSEIDLNAQLTNMINGNMTDVMINPPVRKFVCEWGQCGTALNKKDHLMSHIRIHISCKPYSCQHCSKTFKRKQDVRKHERTTHQSELMLSNPNRTGLKVNSTGRSYAMKYSPYSANHMMTPATASVMQTKKSPNTANASYLLTPPATFFGSLEQHTGSVQFQQLTSVMGDSQVFNSFNISPNHLNVPMNINDQLQHQFEELSFFF